ncbi:hypothetical protein ACFXHA_14315 [Nocardia sp. NPDC059240]|uniref:hypothetical protein n=1 Tax=Nocardia sp. NPDC059240 TaxID=3346786 RepID=UPI0036BB73D4
MAFTTRALGLAALGAAVAAVAATGTTATADTTTDSVTVSGSNYQVGCTYTLSAPSKIYGFTDPTDPNSTSRLTNPSIPFLGSSTASATGRATANWTPTVVGTHQIYADYMLGFPMINDASGHYGPVVVQVTAATTPKTC